MTAPSEIMTHDQGYFAVLSDAWSTNWVDPDDLGARWIVLDNTYKPFPCGIVAHPAIEAATLLHDQLTLEGFDQIDHVSVACNPLVVELMGRSDAKTGLEARFCAIHGVVVGLLTGRGGLAEFSDAMSIDAEVVRLRGLTTLEPDEAHTRQAATVTVHLHDGSTLGQDVTAASGSRERPLTDHQLRSKFNSLVEPYFPGRANAIADMAMRLGSGVTITDIDLLVARS
jgi:2-methylcitrate dehydratase PrpD